MGSLLRSRTERSEVIDRDKLDLRLAGHAVVAVLVASAPEAIVGVGALLGAHHFATGFSCSTWGLYGGTTTPFLAFMPVAPCRMASATD
jgi:hypothetical protein